MSASPDPRLFVGSLPEQIENAEAHAELLTALADRLLVIGGERVVVPHYYPDFARFILELVAGRGRAFDRRAADLLEGEPSECHENVVALWRQGHGNPCTGFALSEDGLWRAHSWLCSKFGRVIETTENRVAYFGYEFDDEEGARLFAEAFDADDEE